MSCAIKAYDSRLHQSNQGLWVQQSLTEQRRDGDAMDHSYFTLQFNKPASLKVILKFATNRLNFSIFPMALPSGNHWFLLDIWWKINREWLIWRTVGLIVPKKRCDNHFRLKCQKLNMFKLGLKGFSIFDIYTDNLCNFLSKQQIKT